MKSRTMASTLLALALVVGWSSAARAEIQWAKSYKAAVAEAKERGVLILCVLVQDGEAANDQTQEIYRSDKAVHKACAQFVCLMANRNRQHGEEKVVVGGKRRTVCKVCRTISCLDHQRVESYLVSRYGEVFTDDEGNIRTPVQWLIDATGKVVEVIAAGDRKGGFDVVPAGQLAGRLDAAARKAGVGLSKAEYDGLKKALAEADLLMAKEKWAAAAAKYQSVVKGSRKRVTSVETAEAKLAQIGERGQPGIDEAKALAAAKKFAEAMARLDRVAKEFANSPAADAAAVALAEIKADPTVAKMLSDRKSLAASGKLLRAAQSAEKRRRWQLALSKYDACASKYPATPAGATSKKRATEIRGDAKIMNEINEAAAGKDCRKWLNLARNFADNGLTAKARLYLQKVLDKYPGTSFAKEAEARLSKLR